MSKQAKHKYTTKTELANYNKKNKETTKSQNLLLSLVDFVAVEEFFSSTFAKRNIFIQDPLYIIASWCFGMM